MRSRCPSVKCLSAHKFLTGWKTLSLCYCTWFNHRQSGTYGVSCPATPPLPFASTATAAVSSATHTHTHTHSPSPFLSPSLQIRAAEVYCYFTRAGAARGGWLPCEWGIIMSWRHGQVQPNSSDKCFNTSYRETAVLQISAFSVTLTNVLLGLCRSQTVSKALCSCPPSQHRHLNHHTHSYTHTHTHTS